MTDLNIIGAGMAGLLAANLLRHRNPHVYEKQSSLPNNHSAVLRFRSSVVGDSLNIPFRQVTMIKDTIPWLNPVADSLAYSFKNTGTYRSDRSVNKGLEVGQRWIAPSDLIQRMAERVAIMFNSEINLGTSSDPVISTIPMPSLMKALNYEHQPKFIHQPGLNIRATILNCDAYVSLVVPDPHHAFSRISITGNELIIEVPHFNPDSTGKLLELIAEQNVASAAQLLGLELLDITDIAAKPQMYAKILPIDEGVRKNFMFWATDKFGIYSLGRYATWRPHLLLDDLINDIRLIDRWLHGDRYAVKRHR